MALPPAKRAKTAMSGFDLAATMNEQVRSANERAAIAEQDERRGHEQRVNEILKVLISAEAQAVNRAPSPNSIYEFEARIGTFSGSFRSGISDKEFSMLKLLLAKKKRDWQKEVDTETTTTFTWQNPMTPEDRNHLRVIFNERGQVETTQIKKKISDASLTWPTKSWPYACRLACAREEEVRLAANNIHPDHSLQRRLKIREKYRIMTAKGYELELDLTEVQSGTNSVMEASDPSCWKVNEITYEVELEVTQNALIDCKFGAPDENPQLKDLARGLYDVIIELQDLILAARTDQFADLHMVKITDKQQIANLKGHVGKCCHMDPPDDFPGSMPVNFSRRFFPDIQTNNYFVSEKTDGVRYFLLLVQDLGCFLVDRSLNFYKVPGYSDGGPIVLADFLADANAPTLLDGEMVRHLKTQQPIFLIFDILELNGSNLMELSYEQRLSRIQTVVEGFRNGTARLAPNLLEFPIMGKVIHPKKHVETMFRSIKEHSKHGHIERIFSDQRRCHYTDGVIFAPDEPYHLKATPNFFKWKYTDKQTVDFRVVLKSGGLREVDLYIGTETGEMLVKPVQLKEHDWMRLNRDIRAAAANSPNAPTIAEWAYEPWSGTWKYHFLRPDKNKPNFIRIFHETMESIAESIPAHEIIKRLTLTPETDRFEAHLRAKATLLGTGQPQQQQQQQQHRQHRHPSQQHQHHHQHQGGQGHYAPPAGGPPANANGHQAPEEPGYYTEALPE